MDNSFSIPKDKRGMILLGLFVGGAISLLCETIINVALPFFMKEFSVSANDVQWLTTGYMLIIGILVPLTAFLLEWFSSKQVFLVSMVIFILGTIIAGFANSFSMLLLGRFIQAVGTGPMVPLMVSTTLQVTPREEHGKAMGMCQLIILAAPALAPALAGILIQYVSWRWLFFFVIPFALLAAIIGARCLNINRNLKKPKLDILSVVLSCLGFGIFIYGVTVAGAMGIVPALIPLGLGIVLLALFVWREFSVSDPMLNLSPLRFSQFRLGLVVVTVLMMSYFANILLLPIYLQSLLLITPLVTGFIMLPGGLLNGVCSPFSGKLYDRFGPRVIIPAGLGALCLGMLGMALVSANMSIILPIVLLYTFMMLGMPFAMTPIQTNSLSGLPREMYPHGTAIMNTIQMIASSLGSSLFIGIMSSRQSAALVSGSSPSQALKLGLELAFFVGAVILFLTFLVSLRIKNSKKH